MVDDTPASIDWNPLGEVYYRKLDLYDMFWVDRFDFKNCVIAAGSYGGPIALTKKTTMEGGNTNIRSIIYICTASGLEQATFKWDEGRLVQMDWSNKEELICVVDDGSVFIYNMFGSFERQFSFGLEIQRSYILEAEIFTSSYGTGVCVLSGDYQFFVVNNIEDIKVKSMQCSFVLDAPPSCWSVLCTPDDRASKVLMAVDSTIYELDTFQPKSKMPPVSHPVKSYIGIAISFDQKFVALFADTGLLWIGSSNLQDVYCQYNTHLQVRPRQLTWCGSGAVVGYWDNYLMVVGPTKETIKYNFYEHFHEGNREVMEAENNRIIRGIFAPCILMFYSFVKTFMLHSRSEFFLKPFYYFFSRYFVDSSVYLKQEIDGVRVIGNYKQEFLQKVPIEVEDVFKLGSMKPGAMLHEASREFERKSARVDDYMKAVKDHLQEAVHECIKAAGHEFEPAKQRSLLKAAAFGKSFLQDMRPQAYVEMAQTIRVLNNVRDFKVGIPITFHQLQRMTSQVLIDRLVARRLYYLAIQICNYLRIPKRDGASRILAHWACYKVMQRDIDDNEIVKTIVDKIGDTPGISYTDIASKALEVGRNTLAIKLLDYEPKAGNQVPLLMKMNKGELALQKAVDSGDGELVYMVTEHMRKKLDRQEFLWKIRDYPVALSLFIKCCKEQNRPMLTAIYDQEDEFRNSGNTHIEDSFSEKSLTLRINLLSKAKKCFDTGMFQFGSQITDEHIRLLGYQSYLQDQQGKQYFNLSVSDMLYQLTYRGSHSQAESLRKEFGIPDVRYWWTKLQALGAARDWDELSKFAKSKKSPIGYEPFVETCWKFGKMKNEAEKYIIKVPLEKRAKLYLKVGLLEQAADVAFQTKSMADLNLIFSKCQSHSNDHSYRSIAEKINVYRSQLVSRK